MSPETVQLKAWRDVLYCTLVKERLVWVAIDEAHCIVEWSVDKFNSYVFKFFSGVISGGVISELLSTS